MGILQMMSLITNTANKLVTSIAYNLEART